MSDDRARRGRDRAGERLVVLAKAPIRGAAKTRLAAAVGSEAALVLADAFLEDTLAVCSFAGRPLTVAFTPAEARPVFASLPGIDDLVPQPEDDMGGRLTAALAAALHRDDRAVLIGTDTPHLSPRVIDEAFRGLAAADIVLGPARDGGFYLLGLRDPRALCGLFSGVAWSTDRVFSTVHANADRKGLRTSLLEPFTDIDDGESLAAVLAESPPSAAPRTREAVASLAAEVPA